MAILYLGTCAVYINLKQFQCRSEITTEWISNFLVFVYFYIFIFVYHKFVTFIKNIKLSKFLIIFNVAPLIHMETRSLSAHAASRK